MEGDIDTSWDFSSTIDESQRVSLETADAPQPQNQAQIAFPRIEGEQKVLFDVLF